MYIISWNIIDIASRFEELQSHVNEHKPDYVCLQKVRNNSTRYDFQIAVYRQLYSMQDCVTWSGAIIYAKLPENGVIIHGAIYGLGFVVSIACDDEPDIDTLVGDFYLCYDPLLVIGVLISAHYLSDTPAYHLLVGMLHEKFEVLYSLSHLYESVRG